MTPRTKKVKRTVGHAGICARLRCGGCDEQRGIAAKRAAPRPNHPRPSTSHAERAAARLRSSPCGIRRWLAIFRHGRVRSRPITKQPIRDPGSSHSETRCRRQHRLSVHAANSNPFMNVKRIGQLLALMLNAAVVACAGNASRSGGRHPRAPAHSHGSCGSMSMSNGPCPPKEDDADANKRWRLSRDAPPGSGESDSDSNTKSKSRSKTPSEPSNSMGGSCGGMH